MIECSVFVLQKKSLCRFCKVQAPNLLRFASFSWGKISFECLLCVKKNWHIANLPPNLVDAATPCCGWLRQFGWSIYVLWAATLQITHAQSVFKNALYISIFQMFLFYAHYTTISEDIIYRDHIIQYNPCASGSVRRNTGLGTVFPYTLPRANMGRTSSRGQHWQSSSDDAKLINEIPGTWGRNPQKTAILPLQTTQWATR